MSRLRGDPGPAQPSGAEGCAGGGSSRSGTWRCVYDGLGPSDVRGAAARRRRLGWRSAQVLHGGASASRALLRWVLRVVLVVAPATPECTGGGGRGQLERLSG